LFNAVSKDSHYAMDLSNVAPGVYIVSLQNGDQLLTERIIKQ
jgi:fibronectin type 3 domain-containing protein